jgi:hypothetical protein
MELPEDISKHRGIFERLPLRILHHARSSRLAASGSATAHAADTPVVVE